ncbi:cell division protein FtsL [Lederbergia lenta]|uniref:Cell division protein FtsL n=1 Tax=Lederbergia lenta TaxID=1467 RepID=A0A2X4W773_LEDLE|nr:cell division protein FtsL [Lederbergia lenta]MCM3110244.1 cell division protein FtsL [Lederbergia lenta]MEC2324188.1 cell division protein FtsL [Lederbergia lenta]SQI60507.1 cell division protein FtsL [Lederbergia lenta]
MSNLARKNSQQMYESTEHVKIQTKKVQRHAKITPGEKILAVFLVAMVAFMAVKIISAQASIYEVNKEIEDTKTAIHEQQKINSDLEDQISDLSKYDRVRKIAQEQGLDLKENNVKVVEKK